MTYQYILICSLPVNGESRPILELAAEGGELPPNEIMQAAVTRLRSGECASSQMTVLAVPLGRGTDHFVRLFKLKAVTDVTDVLAERIV